MLQQLYIKNYATVDILEIEFQVGMSVITGETGAGKSIILGALGLALGDRADKTTVRSGTKQADISAEFNTSQISQARQWLIENDMETGCGTCIIRRVVNSDGRSKGYINGSPVTLSSLKILGEMLIDIHSQHEHQSLLRRTSHQRLLDDFCVDHDILEKMHSTWKQWQQNFRQLQEISTQSQRNSAQTQLLTYQLNELEELTIGTNEVETLETEYKILSHADETISAVQVALDICSENNDQNASSLLNQALTALRDLPGKNNTLTSTITLLESADIQLCEAIADLNAFKDKFEADPEQLEKVNSRLSDLHTIARKHKVQPRHLESIIESLRKELSRFQNNDAELERMNATDHLLREQYQKLASEVSSLRSRGAVKLAKEINNQIQQLGMPHAEIQIEASPTKTDEPSINGIETIEFRVSTNPGQPPEQLKKIASGGELSRISLAIQVVTAKTSQTPCLVFDEVDVGIGGGIAKSVGQLLRELGGKAQILCVTHQAQVAGQGHHHFVVSKTSRNNSTRTRINKLASNEKVREVARMLGGEEFSDESLAHAKQMVASSQV